MLTPMEATIKPIRRVTTFMPFCPSKATSRSENRKHT
jgi:hypothetical protein